MLTISKRSLRLPRKWEVGWTVINLKKIKKKVKMLMLTTAIKSTTSTAIFWINWNRIPAQNKVRKSKLTRRWTWWISSQNLNSVLSNKRPPTNSQTKNSILIILIPQIKHRSKKPLMSFSHRILNKKFLRQLTKQSLVELWTWWMCFRNLPPLSQPTPTLMFSQVAINH